MFYLLFILVDKGISMVKQEVLYFKMLAAGRIAPGIFSQMVVSARR